MSQFFLLRFKCAKCAAGWMVETTPPMPEPVSCCPRCGSFVREFAGREEIRQLSGPTTDQDRRPAADANTGRYYAKRRGPARIPPVIRLH